MSDNQSNNPVESPGSDQINPDELMGEVNKLSFFRTFTISVIVHVVLIGVTSIGFITLCAEHNTLHPDVVIRRIAKEERAEELRKEREEAQKQLIADQKKAAKSRGSGATRPASKIGQKMKRKSTTLPAKSGVGLEDIDEL